MTLKELKEQKERDRQYRVKALNYLINEKGFVLINSDDKATILQKGSFFAFVHNNKTTFQNPHNWSLSILKIKHEDIENYDFIEDEIVRIGGEVEEPKMKLKELREQAGITQLQLAERSGVAIRTIRAYEQGQRDLMEASYRILKAMADVLEIKVEELF